MPLYIRIPVLSIWHTKPDHRPVALSREYPSQERQYPFHLVHDTDTGFRMVVKSPCSSFLFATIPPTLVISSSRVHRRRVQIGVSHEAEKGMGQRGKGESDRYGIPSLCFRHQNVT
ncbi:hypothetical protein CH063_01757 [Colletotrichum higginsianum]|uniref:Uncharacterized protein n=1 Tax=Colletotrichum higginsianum (strain IMI 349063) TaxID=759273 RepID=H1VBV5_COLHI|nr:hypothetical protein CH063_01757 [Colletotrichum higginsianum]